MKTTKGKNKEKKGKKVKKLNLEEHKRYEKDGSSDDEMPDVVSNAAMKDDLESLNKQLANLKQQMRQAEKTKRRNRQEMFIAQKKTKMSNMALNEGDDDLDPMDHPSEDTPTELQNTTGSNEHSKEPPRKPKRKVYPSLNVTVEPLTKNDDCRASSALDFKTRRLTNVPRESVKTAVIAYSKKLRVRK